MIRLNTFLAIYVVVFAQVWAGDDGDGRPKLGGYEDLDVRDPHVKILADLAVVDYNARGNNIFYKPLIEILSAKKTRGTYKKTYAIVLLLGTSSCRKNRPTLPQCLLEVSQDKQVKQAIEARVTEDLDGAVREQISYTDIPWWK